MTSRVDSLAEARGPRRFFKSFNNTSEAEAGFSSGPGGRPHSEDVDFSSVCKGGAGDDEGDIVEET